MDNATYDELSGTPINTDETYSRLRRSQVNTKPSYELQTRADTNQSTTKEAKQNNSKNLAKYIVVMMIMMVILVLITLRLVSVALSVAAYSKSGSEQSKVISQFDKTNNDIITEVTRIAATQRNISQKVLTHLTTIQSNISEFLTQLDAKLNNFIAILQIQSYCGSGLWHCIVSINMSDPTQQCPPAWREYNNSGVRACGRPENMSGSCLATVYSVDKKYSKVCGRLIGYQVGSPDAFKRNANNGIDLDGINITHGEQHNHVWSYIAGLTQNSSSQDKAKCPCSADNGHGREPPPSIGNNYYCESGTDLNTANIFMNNCLYSNDPLWDGLDCEGTCCNGTNSPPWFSVQLPAPTTDVIQVSICCDQGTDDEDVPIKLIEIYVQ